MKIGVMSDTHLRNPDPVLDRILNELLGDTDMILHAGDIVSHRVLDYLEERGVLAVCGNMDDYEVAGAIPQHRMVQVADKRVAVIHGWGSKDGLAQRIRARLAPENPDLIVFGHSHRPFWGEVDGMPMFNPGSASVLGHPGTASVGIIEFNGGRFDGRFLPVQG